MTTTKFFASATVSLASALGVGASALDELPRSYLLGTISLLTILFTTALSLIVWSFKRGVERIEKSMADAKIEDASLNKLIVMTQAMVVEVANDLRLHQSDELRMMEGFAKTSTVAESLDRLQTKLNNHITDAAVRFKGIETTLEAIKTPQKEEP